jgi:hypothetical protein
VNYRDIAISKGWNWDDSDLGVRDAMRQAIDREQGIITVPKAKSPKTDVITTVSPKINSDSSSPRKANTSSNLSGTKEYQEAYKNMDNTGIIMDRDTLIRNKFNNFIISPYLDIFDKIRQTREVVFFTKPDLNLMSPNGELLPTVAGQPEFIDAFQKNREIFYYLSHQPSITSPFIPLLTNTLKNTIDLPDITMETKDTVKNAFGTNLLYRTNSEKSDEDHRFTLEFEDSKYGELYSFFDVWDKYSSLTSLGIIDPRETHVLNGTIDDNISMFKIILDQDLRTIIKIVELVGCFPENVPRSSYSETKMGSMLYNISWYCHFIVRSEAEAVNDFNSLYKKTMGTLRKSPKGGVYDGGRLVFGGIPFIVAKTIYGKKTVYSLEWENKI